MIFRRPSKPIQIGSVTIGSAAPIVVQSMTKTDTRNALATINQIRELEECGCEVVRVAIPDMAAAQTIPAIKSAVSIPVIADIHFDYRLALAALKGGVDQVRINPGNIGNPERVSAIVGAAKERAVPIRIGVNAGSMPKSTPESSSIVDRMIDAALEQVRLLESLDFDLIEVSLKAFDVPTTVEANKSIAQKIPYPLHLGITEAGLPKKGAIRSAVGLGMLLSLGIGDSIRVSLSGDPAEEVATAYEILKSLHLRERGPTLVACPSCGRADVDIISLAQAVEERLAGITKPIVVAVMGCEVNGPGEARDADVGIACGKGRGAIFRKGEIVGTVEEKDFLSALMSEIEAF